MGQRLVKRRLKILTCWSFLLCCCEASHAALIYFLYDTPHSKKIKLLLLIFVSDAQSVSGRGHYRANNVKYDPGLTV